MFLHSVKKSHQIVFEFTDLKKKYDFEIVTFVLIFHCPPEGWLEGSPSCFPYSHIA